MMKNIIKNVCLIGFALIFPITLPAGGIQKDLNENKTFNSAKEIILNCNYLLYTYPKNNAQTLITLYSGSTLSILRKCETNERDIWLRVELATNPLIDNPNKATRGWIKM